MLNAVYLILFLQNFANFLKKVRRDYERAKEYYVRAIRADPSHKMVRFLCNFVLCYPLS